MTPEEQYPSTSDCAGQLKDGDDAVLLCLVNSRKRIVKGHTRSTYHNVLEGSVCALGAVFVEDGFDNGKGSIPRETGMELWGMVESLLSEEAKEAIDLLNEAALELHPEAASFGDWCGPLEWVNQEYRLGERYSLTYSGFHRIVKREVLRCYDLAIEKRRALVAV